MIRKIFILLICMFIYNQYGFAKEIEVKIKPESKITTSNPELKEGDSLNFIVTEDVSTGALSLKKGQKVEGTVTSLTSNGFDVLPASLYVENFRTYGSNNNLVKLNGIVYKKGNDHNAWTDLFVIHFIRGGEVQMNPEKDQFVLYLEEKS